MAKGLERRGGGVCGSSGIAIMLVVVGILLPLRAVALPEAPAIWREVIGVDLKPGDPTKRVFTHPHIPGFRTTKDGRIGVVAEGGGTSGAMTPAFALFRPEQEPPSIPLSIGNSGPVLLARGSDGKPLPYSNLMTSRGGRLLPDIGTAFTLGGKRPAHAAIWDDGGNPQSINEGGQIKDVYSLKIFVSSNTSTPKRNTQFFMTPVKVFVKNPKSPNAEIERIEKMGEPIGGPEFEMASGFEPVVVGDGRLLIIRVGGDSVPWKNPNEGGVQSGLDKADVRYAYYEKGESVDVKQWDNLIPLSYAPFDKRINRKFGFARYPFRDAQGTLIPAGEDIGGSYPWIDREAKNVFIETGYDTLANRYVNRDVPGYSRGSVEDVGKHRGVTALGLWTRGKLVQLDNMNNSLDYGVQEWYRLVKLFDDKGPGITRSPQGNPGELLLGYGRAGTNMPLGENDNGNIIDSAENVFNYRKEVVPVARKEVTWHFTSGHQTDELVFDDFLEPDAFIVASMAGLTSFVKVSTDETPSVNYHKHWNGWNGASFDEGSSQNPVRFQNAATDDGSRWKVPPFGELVGGGRLEPTATGGVVGKGLWLDGQNGLRFEVDSNQPSDVLRKDWFVGVFIDSRFDDSTERQVVTFPDGSGVRLTGRSKLLYHDATGAVVHRISLPTPIQSADVLNDLLPHQGWAHLGFQVYAGNRTIDFFLDGMKFDRWKDPKRQLFRMKSGAEKGYITVGKSAGGTAVGFRGWIDEFKVLARRLDPESACNQANGSVIGLPELGQGLSGSAQRWITLFANRFPDWSHRELSEHLRGEGERDFPKYACFFDYTTDRGARGDNIPPGSTALRSSFHFPEGPLFHDRPRPDSRSNRFCLSCHFGGGAGGLGLGALSFRPKLDAKSDTRRQPLESPKKVFGFIPKGLVNLSSVPKPEVDLVANGGKFIDEWTMSTFGTKEVPVASYSVVDNSTGRLLMTLVNGAVIDPVKLGTTNLAIRANLESAQGWVKLSVDGQKPVSMSIPPYKATLQPLTAGTHTLEVDREFGGRTVPISFSIAGGSRAIASFRGDFQGFSPKKDWRYLWNERGTVTDIDNFSALSWNAQQRVYTPKGARFPDFSTSFAPFLLVNQNGGHPGRGSGQNGGNPESFAIFEYSVPADGTFAISEGSVAMPNSGSNGGQLIVFYQKGGSRVEVITSPVFGPGSGIRFSTGGIRLSKGDRIYVGVGPNGTDLGDSFTLDYNIAYISSN